MRTWDVYVKSALVFLLAALATFALNHHFTLRLPDSTLRLALAFSLLQVAATFTLAGYLIVQRYGTRFYGNICDQLRPALQENVSAVALSGQAWPAAVPQRGLARQVLEECLSASLFGLRDSGRDRLAKFVWDQGFARQWQHACSARSLTRRRRAIALLGAVCRVESRDLMRKLLTDSDPAIRVEAARSLLATGDLEMIDRIFRAVLAEPLLSRILLAADLKRHARFLLSRSIPSVLSAHPSAHPSMEVVNCLEILSAWKLAIPGLDILPLLNSTQHLPLVVALLPYVPVPDSVEDHLRAALETADVDIRCAAARAAGQLKLNGLLPTLLPLLKLNARLAAASAQALAQMGPEGEIHLRAVLSGPDRTASAAALEALETLAVGT